MAKLPEGDRLERRARKLGVDITANLVHKVGQGVLREQRIMNYSDE